MNRTILALAALAFASTASASIGGGSHDLTKASYGGNTSLPACQYCHAPHVWVAANISGGPLWNRNSHPGPYAVYTSQTLTQVPVLGTASLVCLSCHDGVAMSQVNNGTAPAGALKAVPAYANVGLGLTDDHPVGVTYTAGGYYKNVSASTDVKLYAGKVECASCHDAHGTWDGVRGGAVFARWGTTVDLCAVCHSR